MFLNPNRWLFRESNMGNYWVTNNSCFCEVLLSTKIVPSIVLGWLYNLFFLSRAAWGKKGWRARSYFSELHELRLGCWSNCITVVTWQLLEIAGSLLTIILVLFG